MKKLMIAATIFLSGQMAYAAEIQVMSSNAMREAYLELVPQFEKASGHKVATSFVGSADIMKRMRAGAPKPDISSGEGLEEGNGACLE